MIDMFANNVVQFGQAFTVTFMLSKTNFLFYQFHFSQGQRADLFWELSSSHFRVIFESFYHAFSSVLFVGYLLIVFLIDFFSSGPLSAETKALPESCRS